MKTLHGMKLKTFKNQKSYVDFIAKNIKKIKYTQIFLNDKNIEWAILYFKPNRQHKLKKNNLFKTTIKKEVKKRLEYLRKELKAERISYGELAELQSLSKYIDNSDTELLETAGIQERGE